MNKIIPIITILSFISVNAYAQQSLSDQINAVSEAQDQRESEERASQQAQARHIAEQQKAAVISAEKRREAEIDLQKQKEMEVLSDKKRDQSYEDQLRALDVQQKALQVEADKARVARSNDYIDQELKEKAARTDVIKSEADATRNISEGDKALLEKTGDAEVKKESSIFR